MIEEEKKGNLSSLSDLSMNSPVSQLSPMSPVSPSSPGDVGLGIHSYRNAEISEIYEQLNIGYLIPLSCGQNGKFSDEELKIYQHHLMNSNFISS